MLNAQGSVVLVRSAHPERNAWVVNHNQQCVSALKVIIQGRGTVRFVTPGGLVLLVLPPGRTFLQSTALEEAARRCVRASFFFFFFLSFFFCLFILVVLQYFSFFIFSLLIRLSV